MYYSYISKGDCKLNLLLNYRSRCPVQNIGHYLLFGYHIWYQQIIATQPCGCGTAGHFSVLSWELWCWINSSPISTYSLRSVAFPYTNVFYINTHTAHISMYPFLWSTERTIKLFCHTGHINNIKSRVPPCCKFLPHHSHSAVWKTQSDPHFSTLCRQPVSGRQLFCCYAQLKLTQYLSVLALCQTATSLTDRCCIC
jgi:hypothetical protein